MKTKLDFKMFSATGTRKFLLSCEAVTELSFKKDIVRSGNNFCHLLFRELCHYTTSRARLANGGQGTWKNQLPCLDRETSPLLPPLHLRATSKR